jgi:hypothetical protein
MQSSTENSFGSHWPALAGVTLLTGVASGIGGMSLGLLLRLVQHTAYGYSLREVISSETFLQGVSSASPFRRVLALTLCGIVAGVGWWALYRFGRPLVSIAKAVKENGPSMPLWSTVVHVLLPVAQVTLILVGWGVAQYPWMVRPDLTISNSAAPQSVVSSLLGALALGALVLFPSLALLLWIFKSHRRSSPATGETAL